MFMTYGDIAVPELHERFESRALARFEALAVHIAVRRRDSATPRRWRSRNTTPGTRKASPRKRATSCSAGCSARVDQPRGPAEGAAAERYPAGQQRLAAAAGAGDHRARQRALAAVRPGGLQARDRVQLRARRQRGQPRAGGRGAGAGYAARRRRERRADRAGARGAAPAGTAPARDRRRRLSLRPAAAADGDVAARCTAATRWRC